MSRIAIILLAAVLATGCASAEKLQRKEQKAQVEHILNRTITKPVESIILEKDYIRLPEALLVPCGITYRTNAKVGEFVRVADVNTAYLEVCKKQIEEITKLQPQD